MNKLYLYTVLGALVQIEFPEKKPYKRSEVRGLADPKDEKSFKPFERSCEGSLHLRPGSTVELTEDEFKFIGESHPSVAAQLRFVSELGDNAKAKSATEAPDASSSSSGGGSSSKPGSKSKSGASSAPSDE